MTLTSEQYHLFRHNGFLKLPQRLSEEMVVRLKETIHRDIREEIAPIVQSTP